MVQPLRNLFECINFKRKIKATKIRWVICWKSNNYKHRKIQHQNYSFQTQCHWDNHSIVTGNCCWFTKKKKWNKRHELMNLCIYNSHMWFRNDKLNKYAKRKRKQKNQDERAASTSSRYKSGNSKKRTNLGLWCYSIWNWCKF